MDQGILNLSMPFDKLSRMAPIAPGELLFLAVD